MSNRNPAPFGGKMDAHSTIDLPPRQQAGAAAARKRSEVLLVDHSSIVLVYFARNIDFLLGRFFSPVGQRRLARPACWGAHLYARCDRGRGEDDYPTKLCGDHNHGRW